MMNNKSFYSNNISLKAYSLEHIQDQRIQELRLEFNQFIVFLHI